MAERIDDKCGLQVVRTKQIESKGIGAKQEEAEDAGQPASFHCLFNIGGRSTIDISLIISLSEDPCQCAEAAPMMHISYIQNTAPGPP